MDMRTWDTLFLWITFTLHQHLFSLLKERKIEACGTVSANRIAMPNYLKPNNLKLSKRDDPVFMHSGNLVACAWHDTKRLTLLSTVNKGSPGGYQEIEWLQNSTI